MAAVAVAMMGSAFVRSATIGDPATAGLHLKHTLILLIAVNVVVPALVSGRVPSTHFVHRRSTELAAPNHQRLVQHPQAFQVRQQRRDRLINLRGQIVTAIDLRTRFGIEEGTDGPFTVLVLDSDPLPGMPYALGIPVDDRPIPDDVVEPGPEGGPRWVLRPGLSAEEVVAARENYDPNALIDADPDLRRVIELTQVIGHASRAWEP